MDYEVCVPPVGTKLYHVNLLKAWSEAPELEPTYDAFLGVEADVDWDEEGRERTWEIHQQMEEGIPLPPGRHGKLIRYWGTFLMYSLITLALPKGLYIR